MSENCTCDWDTGECQAPIGCRAVKAALAAARPDREGLDWLLRDCADFLSTAHSGYIPGSGGDEEWDRRRESWIVQLRAAVVDEQIAPERGK